MASVCLSYNKGKKNLIIGISCSDGGKYSRLLQSFRRNLNVYSYDVRSRKQLTSIYCVPDIQRICTSLGFSFSVEEDVYKEVIALKRYHQKIRESRNKSELVVEGWTDDSDCQLSKYQKTGILVSETGRRFLIGDDMGLGKSPQAIGLILRAFNYYGGSKALVVVPSRVRVQWRSEIYKFAKVAISDVMIYGSDKICVTGQYNNFSKSKCGGCQFFHNCSMEKGRYQKWMVDNAKILIISYEWLDKLKPYIIAAEHDIIVFDEATKLKNMTTKMYKSAKEIINRLPSHSFVYLMSGTFIENSVTELYSAMSLVQPKVLGEFHSFKSRFLVLDVWNRPVGVRNESVLKKLIDPFIIRRTIDQVWEDRPPIIEITRECNFTSYQEKVYNDAKSSVLKEISDMELANKINMAQIAALLAYLMVICGTVKSIEPDYNKDDHSGKLDDLRDLLNEEIAREKKIIIFTKYSNRVLPYIAEMIEKNDCGKYLTVTGGMNQSLSNDNVNRFKADKDMRILLCSDTLAYGANIQCAEYVINFDLPWNPAKLDQRIARVYRRGQTKTVTVVNYLVSGSVEQNVFDKLSHKRKLFEYYLGYAKKKTVSRKIDILNILKSL